MCRPARARRAGQKEGTRVYSAIGEPKALSVQRARETGEPRSGVASFERALELRAGYEELSPSLHAGRRSVPASKLFGVGGVAESGVEAEWFSCGFICLAGQNSSVLEEKEKALGCFERAVKLEPKHLGAYYQLGLLYARNGEKEKSRDAMEMQRQLNAQMHKGLVALRMP